MHAHAVARDDSYFRDVAQALVQQTIRCDDTLLNGAGSVNGEAFEWLADADPRLGPLLEAIINGKYYWVPLYRIRTITIEEPSDLRDFVWTAVQFTWTNDGEAVGFIPTRYPGSENSENHLIRLARQSDWLEQGNVQIGIGQRLLATETTDYPLLDIRSIEFAPIDEESSDKQESAANTEDG